MSLLKKLSAIVPALALKISFSSPDGMSGSLAIDNTLIQSGATTFGIDEIDVSFRDRDFLSTATADGVSVRLLDELGSSGFLSFGVLTADALDDEPWADRYIVEILNHLASLGKIGNWESDRQLSPLS